MTVFDVPTILSTYRVAHIIELFRGVGSKQHMCGQSLSLDKLFIPMLRLVNIYVLASCLGPKIQGFWPKIDCNQMKITKFCESIL